MSPGKRAAETAATQLRRLLHLIPRLADGKEHPVADVAAMAGVSPSTLLRDLDALVNRYDVPAAWVNSIDIAVENDKVSIPRADHLLRPMRLTISELCALELGLMIVQQELGVDDAVHQGALERLRNAITQLPAYEWQRPLRAASGTGAEQAAVLDVIRRSLRDRRKLQIRYRAGADRDTTARTISAHGLGLVSGAWYVVAFCERSQGLRFFRADRIEAATLLEEPTRDRPAAVAEMFPGGRAFDAGSAPAMTVRYSARIARWIAEREGAALAEDGSLTLEHPVADEDWAIRHVLQYGADAEVLAPAELRRAIAARLREMACT